jgi:hypothetical protein
MKYMTIVSQTKPDGTVNTAMTTHDEYQKAVSAFHMELAYGAISDKLASDMAMLADTTGHVYDTCVVQGLAKPVGATDSGTDATATTEASGTTESGITSDTAADAAAGTAARE